MGIGEAFMLLLKALVYAIIGVIMAAGKAFTERLASGAALA